MPDAFFIFRKKLPFTVRLDNGSSWDFSIHTGAKSGYVSVVAAPSRARTDGPGFYILVSGREREVDHALRCGIRAASGTPERGLVSAMRRAGVVIVLAAPLPPLSG